MKITQYLSERKLIPLQSFIYSARQLLDPERLKYSRYFLNEIELSNNLIKMKSTCVFIVVYISMFLKKVVSAILFYLVSWKLCSKTLLLEELNCRRMEKWDNLVIYASSLFIDLPVNKFLDIFRRKPSTMRAFSHYQEKLEQYFCKPLYFECLIFGTLLQATEGRVLGIPRELMSLK